MKFGGEFALFLLENQRDATQFWKSLFRSERACRGERFLRWRNDDRDGQGRSRRSVLSRLRGGVAPGPQPLRSPRRRLALFGAGRSSPPGDAKVFLRATRLPEADFCRALRRRRSASALAPPSASARLHCPRHRRMDRLAVVLDAPPSGWEVGDPFQTGRRRPC